MSAAVYMISNRTLGVQINSETGQVVSVNLDGKRHQYVWPGGKPGYPGHGWRNSDLVMFPVVGPVYAAELPCGDRVYPMTQHGISRHLPWTIESSSDNDTLNLVQEYDAGTRIPVILGENTIEIYWPFSFVLKSSFDLYDNELRESLEITNKSDQPMPFCVGRHPAFNLPERAHRSKMEVERKDLKQVLSLRDLRSLENNVAFLEDANFVRLTGEADGEIFLVELEFSDFGHGMLWSPEGATYIAIEPTTNLPYSHLLRQNLETRQGSRVLEPNASEIYRSVIRFA